MKILVLTWVFRLGLWEELPHVAELYPELVKLGHEVHLITVGVKRRCMRWWKVRVHRVPVALVTTFPLGGEPKQHGLSWG